MPVDPAQSNHTAPGRVVSSAVPGQKYGEREAGGAMVDALPTSSRWSAARSS